MFCILIQISQNLVPKVPIDSQSASIGSENGLSPVEHQAITLSCHLLLSAMFILPPMCQPMLN